MAGKVTVLFASAYVTLGLLAACSQPTVPSVATLYASLSPSAGEPTPVISSPTQAATPRPSTNPDGKVTIIVDGQTLSYRSNLCPVRDWLDRGLNDAISFGSYPEIVVSDAGTRWQTHMFVLRVRNGSARDWSFVLTPPVSSTPSGVEPLLTSRGGGEAEMAVAFSDTKATFRTTFLDSEHPFRRLGGTVTVTCR